MVQILEYYRKGLGTIYGTINLSHIKKTTFGMFYGIMKGMNW